MTLLAFAVLMLGAVAWVTLPLVPALRELFHPTDVEPLVMVGRDNADISRFARHFREYAEANLRHLPPEASAGDYFGRLPDGTPFVRVTERDEVLRRGGLPDGSHDRLVVLEQPLTLVGGERFRLEIWARSRLGGGPGAAYRAVLGENDVTLGARSTVFRWMHAVGTLVVEDGSTLFGRASSDREIRLGRDVGFERIGAPAILVGAATIPTGPPPPADLVPVEAPERARRLGDVLRIEGDFALPPHGLLEGNIVVAGSLRLATGARLRGNAKAHGDIVLEPGAVVEGSTVSSTAVRLAARAWVKGPVIAEGPVGLAGGATVGSSNTPTTVSGQVVSLDQGAVVCGHIVTQEGGHTAP